jgi:hypothetical protein
VIKGLLKDTLVVIMAHGRASDTFNRHLPLWRAHGARLVVFSPTDDPLMAGDEKLVFGHREHHGHHAIDRFRYLLQFLAARKEEWFMIYEYDSFCLRAEFPQVLYETDALWGNLFTDDGVQFKGDRFLHPPIFMSSGVVKALIEADGKWPEEQEDGFWDRWIGRLAQLDGIPCRGYGSLGVSFNTCEDAIIPNFVRAISMGAIMLHGIKSTAALKAVTGQ